MCSNPFKKPKTPKVQSYDPEKAAQKAAADAAKLANAQLAARRANLASSSLLATSGRGVQGPAANSILAQAAPASILAQAKTMLGQ